MVKRLLAAGVIESDAVQRALMTVPRHLYLEGVRLKNAYADRAVMVKYDSDGTAISSASQPAMVAVMLELSALEAGHRVLEIGTGTGYNAALLASIVGTTGQVMTIELEDDLATAARERLRSQGFQQVEVVLGDGSVGRPEAAPFDRIVVTAGAAEIPAAWREQLGEGGRLIVPIVDADGIGVVSCLVKEDAELREISSVPCGFLPLRDGP